MRMKRGGDVAWPGEPNFGHREPKCLQSAPMAPASYRSPSSKAVLVAVSRLVLQLNGNKSNDGSIRVRRE